MVIDSIIETIDDILSWVSASLGQSTDSYCSIETAETRHTLVTRDGSLLSIIRFHGCTRLVGPDEFNHIHQGLTHALSSSMAHAGHAVQVYFNYDRDGAFNEITDIFSSARATAKRLDLNLDDLFEERNQHLAKYCASEACFFVLWTRPNSLSPQQLEMSNKQRLERRKEGKMPPTRNAQDLLAAIPELRESHDSFVRTFMNDIRDLWLHAVLLDVHTALHEVRKSVDPDVTGTEWQAVLPGDKIPLRSIKDSKERDISELLWPPIVRQVIPRDAEILNLRTCRIGDRLYASQFIDLFPKDIQSFFELFKRLNGTHIPWRMSYLIESDGLPTLGIKPTLAAILSFASPHNKLIADAATLLNYIHTSSDDAVVRLRVSFATWIKTEDLDKLRMQSAELIKAIQGWGLCEVAEISGDPYSGALSSALALKCDSVATASIAPISDVCYMLPFARPASPWNTGALLLRSPDGKPWPYQPGSTQQTTWIDLVYARPGSGKSVLSNTINLALCLQPGITRLPRISIIDIGPSSSGLIALLQGGLPEDKRHLVAYHRLRMTPDYAINPFDTQLGCRKPSALDRSFLVNFITLLATPVGQARAYDGISDMTGMIIDEMYKNLMDGQAPNRYTADMNTQIDAALQKVEKVRLDGHTTWWEITDVLFEAGHIHEAGLAQRYAMPLLADSVSICRTKVIEDLYGKIVAPTGEPLISAFGRMISSAVREYPILSRITAFDLGEARVVSLDLDEVAKTGGESADRQTAIMYMLARYVLGRHFYLTEESLEDVPKNYQDYHRTRIMEIREDPKRLVMDEFHRTSTAKAVRDQVVVDMREGRKWKVQVALLSQSLDDFDSVMVEFATSIFIMDAGPKQAVDKSIETFGLSETARLALTNRVHGPRAEGATFLAQFATKMGTNTQLCTNTLGPIELWAFNTTAEDARIRNALYKHIGGTETRKLLAMLYPAGSAAPAIEQRLGQAKEAGSALDEEKKSGIIQRLIDEILEIYNKSKTATR